MVPLTSVSQVVKFLEVQNRMVAVGLEEGDIGSCCSMGIDFTVMQDANVLAIYCTTYVAYS